MKARENLMDFNFLVKVLGLVSRLVYFILLSWSSCMYVGFVGMYLYFIVVPNVKLQRTLVA